MNLGNHLQGLLGDLRFAARSLRRSPGFAATTIVSLALGVALTALTLSITNSYVVRAMPFPNSERLYRALYDSPGQPEPRGLERVDWKSLGDVVEVADYSGLGRFILHTDNYPQEISPFAQATSRFASVYMVTCILLVTAGLFATWLPARRVARTDPMTALRAE